MTTYRELIYMCLDLVKGISDDFSYTEDHVMYLLDKYRALLLKQRYGNDPKKYIPLTNYSNIEVELDDSGRSIYPIPAIMNIGIIPRISVYDKEYYDHKIEYVPRERFPFVGESKFLKGKIGYCTLSYNDYLITKDVVQEDNGRQLILTAVLETPEKKGDLESIFPLEESLIPNLIQMVIKDLLPASYRPNDDKNNATDDLATLAGYLSKLLKKPYTQNLSTTPEDDE